jgi:hypothetical protein
MPIGENEIHPQFHAEDGVVVHVVAVDRVVADAAGDEVAGREVIEEIDFDPAGRATAKFNLESATVCAPTDARGLGVRAVDHRIRVELGPQRAGGGAFGRVLRGRASMLVIRILPPREKGKCLVGVS